MDVETNGKVPDGSNIFMTRSSEMDDMDDLSTVQETIQIGQWGTLIPMRYGRCNEDHGVGHAKYSQMVKLIAVAMVPVIILTVQNAITLSETSANVKRTAVIRDNILFSIETANVIHTAQLERGNTALYIGSDGDSSVYSKLKQKYNDTDAAIASLTMWPELRDSPEYFRTRKMFHDRIKAFRASVHPSNTTVKGVIDFYSKDIAVIISWVADSIKFSRNSDLWQTLVSYHMLILSKEEAGVERALGSTFYAQG